jgi:carbon monoxide dehydrogenase subunit G
MILANEFTVQAPVEQVWALLGDLEKIVPCMPGATFLGKDGDENKVAIKLKVGAISTHFQGSVRFTEKDPLHHTARIEGAGKDTGGKAAASATILVGLEDLANCATRVRLKTDLALTGKLAQFGSGLIGDISTRIISQFAENLHRAVDASPPQAVAAPPSLETVAAVPSHAPYQSQPQSDAPALDMGPIVAPIARNLVLKYVLVPAMAFIAGWFTCWLFH